MLDWNGILIGVAMVAMIGLACYLEAKYPAKQRPRKPMRPVGAFCALCVHRHGEDCIHPDSPVAGQPCGPVCSRELRGHLRSTEGRRGGTMSVRAVLPAASVPSKDTPPPRSQSHLGCPNYNAGR